MSESIVENRAVEDYGEMLTNLEGYFREILNIRSKDGKRELRIRFIKLPPKPQQDSFDTQKRARSLGLTMSKPITADLELVDSGKVIDRKEVVLLSVPEVTQRGTFIVQGSEYTFPLQKRLIPGVYTTKKNNGTVTTWINSSAGRNYTVVLNANGVFHVEIKSSSEKGAKLYKLGLYPLLIALGFTEQQMLAAWGKEVIDIQLAHKDAQDVTKALKTLYDGMRYETDPEAKTPDAQGYLSWIMEYLANRSELDPDNVAITMGKAYKRVEPEVFFNAATKALEVMRGTKEEDNKESLVHAQIMSVSDFAIERLKDRQYRQTIKTKLQRGVETRKKIDDIVYKDIFQKPFISVFTQTSLARTPKQTNPMDMMSSSTELTIMGEGGIQTEQAVTFDVRAVDPSHLGFLDPIQTPEGSNIGTTLHLSIGAKKKGKELVTRVLDIKSGKEVWLNPRQFYAACIAYSEAYDRVNKRLKPDKTGLVQAVHRHKDVKVRPQEVQYAMRSIADMVGPNALAIPFLTNNNGVRCMTASKMQAQAKPLKYREAPLVQAATSEAGDKTVEQEMGKHFCPTSPVDGRVKAIKGSKITIEEKSGTKHDVEVPAKFWLNESNFVDAEITVQVGDVVKKDQPLADTNYTKGGTLALGVNLNVAYVAYKGYNHEDGVVVSEAAAEKLTSLHAHQNSVPVPASDVLHIRKYMAYFPGSFRPEQLANLDEEGVVKEGSTIQPGDPLVVKMRKAEEDVTSKRLKSISRLLATEFRDASVYYEKDHAGVVAEVTRRRGEIFIVVRTEERARIGDKLVGRYGNKGTITQIVPDAKMPHNEDGQVMDILLAPPGVSARMNTGQILETNAARVAEREGKPYLARPAGTNGAEQVTKDLARHKLTDSTRLIDPEDGPLDSQVTSGKQYFLKLEHQVEKKLSARGAGDDEMYSLSGQPSSGGGVGGRAVGLNEMYALLAHGATANMRDMYTFKGDQNPEFWRALEKGYPLPPPDQPASSKRLVGMMRAVGVNLVEQGHMAKMTPFLDRDVKKISNGEIKTPGILRANDLKEESGGLFDLPTTGGLDGEKWTHIRLAEPMPHPTFEKSIMDVLRMSSADFDAVMTGKKFVAKDGTLIDEMKPGALSGGLAIRSLLSKVNPEASLERAGKESLKARGSDLNKLNREMRILRNLSDNGVKPQELVIELVPVMPPKFRPIAELPNGDLTIADANEHYRSLILVNDQLKAFKRHGGGGDIEYKAKGQLYEAMRGTMGYSQGVVGKPQVKGIAATISGNQPKDGWYLSKTIRRRQDMSGTGVIEPEPNLSMDELGVPENMAWTMFKPLVVARMHDMGIPKIEADKQIAEKSVAATRALDSVMNEHHVIANRAPTLHRLGMMAFRPKLVSGSAIKVPVETLAGFGADFDGDSCWGSIFVLTPPPPAPKLSCVPSDAEQGQYLASSAAHQQESSYMPVIHTDLKDFPRTELISTKDNVEFWGVPEGTQVYSYDRTSDSVRLMPVTGYSIHHNLSMRRVQYRSKRHVEVSSDHSLFTIDPKTLELGRSAPDASIGLYTPRPRRIHLPAPIKSIKMEVFSERANAFSMLDEAPLDGLFGYFLGAMIGDGYASGGCCCKPPTRVGLCNVEPKVIARAQEFITSMGGGGHTLHDNPHTFNGHECFSQKAHWSSTNLAGNLSIWMGKGSHNKHLPDFWQYGCEEFRLGLLAGLFDTDGSLSVNRSRKDGKGYQFQSNYTTTSERLADEVGMLCASLGIRFSHTTTVRRDNKSDVYTIAISAMDLKAYADKLPLQHPKKRAVLDEIGKEDFGSSPVDSIPFPKDLAERLRKRFGCPRSAPPDRLRVYQTLHRVAKLGVMLRDTLLAWLDEGGEWEQIVLEAAREDERFARIEQLARNTDILWDEVREVQDLGDGHTAYDLTVPDSLVFMLSNTVIVYDTFGIHVVVSKDANEEAKKMLPSQNIYMPGTMRQKVSPTISQEFILGLYRISTPLKTTSKQFVNPESAIRAMDTRAIKPNDVISVKGIGTASRTTAGLVAAMQAVPKELRDYQTPLDAKQVNKLIAATEKKFGAKEMIKVMDHFKHLGRKWAYLTGASLLLSDMKSLSKDRNSLYLRADQKAAVVRGNSRLTQEQKDAELVKIYSEVDAKILGQVKHLGANSQGERNNLTELVVSGARGNPHQVKQIVGSVGLVMDHRNKVIPEPVRGDYITGLSSRDFFAHSFPSRKGMIDRSQSVIGPGALSKELTNTATRYNITTKDCGTKQGRLEMVDRHLLDRVLLRAAGGVNAGAILDDAALDKLKKMKVPQVHVRTPLTCEAPEGLCSMCFGLDEHGKMPEVGKFIGVSEIQAITERSVQLPMKTFHCLSAGNIIAFSPPNGEVIVSSIEDLYSHVNGCSYISEEGVEMKWVEPGWRIWDVQGWVGLERVARHEPDDRMVMVKSDASEVIVCQANHPLMTKLGSTTCAECGAIHAKVAGTARGERYVVECEACGAKRNVDKEEWSRASKVQMTDAGDVSKEHVLSVNHYPIGGDGADAIFPDPWLLGFYLAEGCVNIRKHKGVSRHNIKRGNVARGGYECVAVHIAQHDGEIKLRAQELLGDVPHKVSAKEIKLYDKGLAHRLIREIGQGSSKKRLPSSFLVNATKQQMADLLCGLIDGDGCVTGIEPGIGAPRIQIATTSLSLVQSIQMMCRHLGVSTLVVMTPERESSLHVGYHVMLKPNLGCQWFNASIKAKGIEWRGAKQVDSSATSYESHVSYVKPMYGHIGLVYDVTTSTGTFCAGGIWNHNSGGVASAAGGLSSAFERAVQILRMPEHLNQKAVLASKAGLVERIVPTGLGSHDVFIAGTKHACPQDVQVSVKPGQMVQKGEAITTGVIKPQELLALKDLNTVQGHVRDDLHQTFASAGVNLHKRTYEVMVRGLTDQVRITDPGSCPNYVTGDYASFAQVKSWNDKNLGKKPVRFTHEIAGSLSAPKRTSDWAQRMALGGIRQTIQEGAGMGYESSMQPGSFAWTALGPGTKIREAGREFAGQTFRSSGRY